MKTLPLLEREGNPEEQVEDFEDVLEIVGNYGKYQKWLILFFLIPMATIDPYMRNSHIFMLSVPSHGCFEPSLALLTNLSSEDKTMLVRPLIEGSETERDSCRMYSLNYTDVLEDMWKSGWNVTSYVEEFSHKWTTVPCQHGWEFDKSQYTRTAATDWDLVCDKEYLPSLGLTLFSVGSAVGTPIFGAMSDRFGRKRTFLVASIVGLVSPILAVTLPAYAGFLVSKTIHGLTVPSLFQISYILMTEMVAPHVRSYLNVYTCLSWSVGLSLLTLSAWLTANWVWLSWICVLTSIPVVLFNIIIPESPRWLISQNRFDEAKKILETAARTNKKDISNLDMIKMMKKCANKDNNSSENNPGPMREIFRRPSLIKKFIILTFIWSSVNLSYSGFQINISNMHGNEFLNFFLLAVVEFPSYLLTWYMMETKLGRRWTDVIFLFQTAIVCILPMTVSQDNAVFLTVASLFGKFGVSGSFMAIYQQAAEIYPTLLRSSGLSLSGTIANVIGIGAPSLIYLSKHGRHIPYTIFAILCFVSGFCALFIPETLNESLPQTIDDGENFGKQMVFFSFAKTKRAKDETTISVIPLKILSSGDQPVLT